MLQCTTPAQARILTLGLYFLSPHNLYSYTVFLSNRLETIWPGFSVHNFKTLYPFILSHFLSNLSPFCFLPFYPGNLLFSLQVSLAVHL